MSLQDFFNNLPQIMTYFVPGYVFLGVFCFFTSKKIKEVENLFFRSVVISYVFVVLSRLLCALINLDSKYDIYISMLLTMFVCLFSVRVYFSEFYKTFMTKIARVSGHSHIWEDLFDRNKGAEIRGFIRYKNQNVEIKGVVKHYEILDNGDCNIVLWNYSITCPDFDVLAKEDPSKLFYIKSCDIEGLVIFQGKEKQKTRQRFLKKLKLKKNAK